MSTCISPKLEPTTPSGNMTFAESDISDTSVCDDTEFTEMCVDDHGSDQCQWEPSCRKRGRTNSVDVGRNVKNVRGRRGKLSALPDMPLDILYEIFGHLRPYDILRLARTTKPLRHILMRHSASWVWKEARSNVEGLPDCPPDLTEPQYARLAFDPVCYICGAFNVHTVLWACRLRSCQRCINSERFMDSAIANERIWVIISPLQYRPYYSEPLLPHGKVKGGKYHRRGVVSTDEYNTLCEILNALRSDRVVLDEYIQERKELTAVITSHASLCEEWLLDASTDRYGQLRDLKARRKEAIFTRLRDMGWGDELDKHNQYALLPLRMHASVKKPQELTDRIWTNIKQPLIRILEGLKEKRLAAERVVTLKQRRCLIITLLESYVRRRPVTEVIPGPADVCNMAEFKTIIEDTSLDVEVCSMSFRHAMDLLPQLVADWRKAKDAELVCIVDQDTSPFGSPQNDSSAANDYSRLGLATTIFQCKVCQEPISYPRILVHSCVHALRNSLYPYDDPHSKPWRDLNDEPWNFGGNRIGIDLRGKRAASLVVRSCGLDPDTTTAGEMDDLDARFECLGCYDDLCGRLIMGWRVAVHHSMTSHVLDSDPPVWTLVNEVDTATVKQNEEISKDPLELTCCALCRSKAYRSQTVFHLINEHKILGMLDHNLYRPLDAPFPDLMTRLWTD